MKDHLQQLVQAGAPLQGRNIAREYLQGRILGAFQRAGAALQPETWRSAVRQRLQDLDWGRILADVRPFLEHQHDIDLVKQGKRGAATGMN